VSTERWPGGFENAYESLAPWDIGAPQPVFVELATTAGLESPVLDVGCGNGDNAVFLASLGLDVLGIDIVPRAIEDARTKAEERDVRAEFLVQDALDAASLGRTFRTVIDSGLFHALPEDLVPAFVEQMARILEPGGRYHLLCFSDQQPGRVGPRRVSQDEIRAAFADGWTVEDIRPERFLHALSDEGAAAWLARIVRTAAG
jgi:SAM-dependent methyltransferase